MKLQQTNLYKVPLTQWNKWPDIAQRVFNETYAIMSENKELFLHPTQPSPQKEYWLTNAWNAAWTSADAVVKALDDIVAGVGYAKSEKKKS